MELAECCLKWTWTAERHVWVKADRRADGWPLAKHKTALTWQTAAKQCGLQQQSHQGPLSGWRWIWNTTYLDFMSAVCRSISPAAVVNLNRQTLDRMGAEVARASSDYVLYVRKRYSTRPFRHMWSFVHLHCNFLIHVCHRSLDTQTKALQW